jgi:hypothetical protein
MYNTKKAVSEEEPFRYDPDVQEKMRKLSTSGEFDEALGFRHSASVYGA